MQAGFRTSLSLDFEHAAVETFRADHPKSDLEAGRGDVARVFAWIDVVADGPPCQAFSDAGRRDPNDLRAGTLSINSLPVRQPNPSRSYTHEQASYGGIILAR